MASAEASGATAVDCECRYRSIDSLRFLHGLSTRDPEARHQALDVIAWMLDGCVILNF